MAKRKRGGTSPKKKSNDSDDDRKPKKFKEGDKIEAQYKGKSKFYPGVISRARLNGTYDIDYDDGEKETGVAAELIRAKGGSSPKKKSNDSTDDDKPKKYKEGDKIEAQYKGKSKFYPGVISRARLNGTYDIDYDDGEKETGVAADLIKLKGGASPKKKASSTDDDVSKKDFREGDKIEAQYKGKSKFYPGVISRARLNGTYDIDYDDGEKETGVAAELIRKKGGTSPKKKSNDSDDDKPKNTASYRVGAKVEAQYKGKKEYFKGTITKDYGDGRYDIEYDDGDKEFKVSSGLMRPLKAAPAAPSASRGLSNFQRLAATSTKKKSGNSSD
ncbi:hypothetical protein SDRG_04783 [Saprolegnia diclina VS20]|uniref:Tudor domain-containing protein n=1 Tax=Saprolegnia diclina (strain VS20) TaxID=1156394 RepID=T0QSS3_SAPDV|nr:hypothetical protein SDRG_04783 [Saprolegnia diclina VS20]EQC37756.1 hypothetical protein SDRG_04783 [Saprolegnia diclina VS20]|eukprot:XP_008608689.1 hypothetical protein SDRG_04783 [Saprolegnia diclina VS20]